MSHDLLAAGRNDAIEKPGRGRFAGGWPDRLTSIVVALPDRLVLMFLWFAVVVSLTVLLGVFYPVVVLPLAVILIVATWRVRPTSLPADRRSAIGAIVALEIAVGWIQVNRHYRGELLSIARDPGVYTIRAWWLMNHPSPNVPVTGAFNAARGVAGASASAGGFPYTHGSIHPQGNSMVPGLLAVAGWVGKGPALLQANVVLGALGLLAVYAFGRRVVGPIWALAPMIALAASMPMVYFSRNTYTEPVALLVTFIGLTLMWSAWRTRSVAQFGAAGVAFGAAQLARIDGAVAVLGASIGIGLVAALAVDPELRRLARRYLIAFALGAGLMMAIGTLDLIVNSPAYLTAQKGLVGALLVAFVLVVVVLLVLSWFPVLVGGRRALLEHREAVGKVAAALAIVGVLVMLSRPYWFEGHFIKDPPINRMLQVYQQLEGLDIDGTRSYDEQTIHWLAWYIGWPAVLLAAAGMVWMLWHAVRSRRPQLVVFLATFAVVATLYLNDVSITPIQIWAMRRLLPVVIPSLLILGVWFAVRLARRWPPLEWLSVALAVGIAVLPAFSWNSLVAVGEQSGEYSEVQSICRAIHGDKVVLIGDIPASGNYLPTTRVICGKQSIYFSAADKAKLAQVARVWAGGDITVLGFNAQQIPWTTSPALPTAALHSGVYPSWPSPIRTRPGAPDQSRRTLWVGDLQPDGSVLARSS